MIPHILESEGSGSTWSQDAACQDWKPALQCHQGSDRIHSPSDPPLAPAQPPAEAPWQFVLLISLITPGLTAQIPSCSSEEGFWQGQKDRAAWQQPRQELRSGRGAQECTGGHQRAANTSPSQGDTLPRAAHPQKDFSLLCHSFLHPPSDI